MTFRVLAANQLEMGVYGGVAEIGVHHGMSFAPLCLLNADAGNDLTHQCRTFNVTTMQTFVRTLYCSCRMLPAMFNFTLLRKMPTSGCTGAQQSVAVAVDVFEQQGFNTDGSGSGDRHIFESTVERWCGRDNMGAEKFIVIAADSISLDPEQLLEKTGGKLIRFFSVDGSHTEDAAYSDMKTAAVSCSLSPVRVCTLAC